MKIEVINIKSNMPPAYLASVNLEIEIERLTKSDTKLIKVIHGYGSHGVGGEIKKEMLLMLKRLKNNKKIKDYFCIERLSEEKIKQIGLYQDFPELILDNELKNYNSGVTLVLLNNY